MKLAAPYVENSLWRDLPDEYLLLWGKKSTQEKLINFCEAIPTKRINIYTDDDVSFDLDAIIEAKKINPDIYVRLKLYQSQLIDKLKKQNIGFYFDISYPCYNYTILGAMASLGVSDIYISDDLFYNLEKVKQFTVANDIQIRMVLNRAASTSPDRNNDIRGPFVSPRDMDILEQYIDIGEFDCGIGYFNWNKFDVLYRTFFQNREWFGDLRSLNEDIDFYYPVYSTIPDTLAWKIRCRRRCALGENCNHCEIILNVAREWYEQGISVKTLKDQGNSEEELL